MIGANLIGADAFIVPVIPFDQIRIDFGHASKPRQFGCPSGALQRTRQDFDEKQCGQPRSKPYGIQFATFSERQIGKPCVPAVAAPFSFAVTGEIG